MTRAEAAVVRELLAVIDYLAPPAPERGAPEKRARVGIECAGGAWDGGRLWRRTDRRIARVVSRARRAVAR